jgi:hypothetical protein
MKYIAKKSFRVLTYNELTYEPRSILFELKEYNVNTENEDYISINNSIFCKTKHDRIGLRYVYDYFYTEKELRKLKLKKLNEINL